MMLPTVTLTEAFLDTLAEGLGEVFGAGGDALRVYGIYHLPREVAIVFCLPTYRYLEIGSWGWYPPTS